MKLSIILPVYNESENIRPLLAEISAALASTNYDYEIIAIDDGSTDASLAVLRDEAGADRRIKVISFRINSGQSAAFDAGFRNVKGDVVVTMDSDLQNDPNDIPRLVAHLQNGFDLVTGWRKNRKDGFLIRKVPSKIANWLIRKATKTKIHDLGCSLKVYRADLTNEIRLYGEMHRFICPIAESIGAKISELEVNHRPRAAGVSKYGLSRTFKVLLDLTHLVFIKKFQTKPIYVFGGFGMASFLLSIILIAITAFEKVSAGVFVHRNPLFLMAICLTLIGFQFFGTGLIAEILIRTYFESQNKTSFIIREKIGFGDS